MKKILITIAIIITIALVLIGRIDRTPIHTTKEYKTTLENTHQTIKKIQKSVDAVDTLKIGWSAQCIIPKGVPLAVAGYGFRAPYRMVRDSLYARAFAFDDGVRETFVLTLDLMIFPIEVRKRLEEKLKTIGLTGNDIMYSATHTHNGMGGFDPSLLGNVAMGKYSEEATQKITNAAFEALKDARKNKVKGSIGFLYSQSPEWVTNRIVHNGRKENSIRGIKINRVDNKSAAIVTYNAHPTNIEMNYWILSRDYPGAWVKNLEKSDKIDFAAFCAGMVASHGPANPNNNKDCFSKLENMGKVLSDSILNIWDTTPTESIVSTIIEKTPIHFRPSQVRIEKHLKVRDWVFKSASGGLEGDITLFKIGGINWFAAPSDISGEIAIDYKYDEIANAKKEHFMMTSFNGNYVGYITCDAYYDTLANFEIREMNWVGPEYGAYFGDIIKELIEN